MEHIHFGSQTYTHWFELFSFLNGNENVTHMWCEKLLLSVSNCTHFMYNIEFKVMGIVLFLLEILVILMIIPMGYPIKFRENKNGSEAWLTCP